MTPHKKLREFLSFANVYIYNPQKMKDFAIAKSKDIRQRLARTLAPELCTPPTYVPRPFPCPMIKFVRNRFGYTMLKGVEIGVSGGWNAESILETLFIKQLFLIDPYVPYLEAGEWITRASYLPLAKQRLSRFGDRVKFIIKKSSDAVNDIPNGLDFVFIDGNHTYPFVKKDIELYYPKVREGGVIGGDDFTSDYFGVCQAVMEYANTRRLELRGKNPDWWIVK